MQNQNFDDNIGVPLFRVLAKVSTFWLLTNIGYYVAFPAAGYRISYNVEPMILAGYFLLWAAACVFSFWDLFTKWLEADRHFLFYGVLSFGLSAIVWVLLYIFSLLPIPKGPLLVPYTDMLFATPWYFLPKAAEILVQQVLITALILSLYFRFLSLKSAMFGYVVLFGGAHVFLFLLNGAPTEYATVMTLGAIFSTLVFPYMILRVRGGFVFNYVFHIIFYLCFGIFLRT
ncbi:MAG: hypothetical protein WC797_02975 [Candidatus Paceibacterota bacterium]|jgi:hypothetical protein